MKHIVPGKNAYLLLNIECKQVLLIKDSNSEFGLLSTDKGTLSLSSKAYEIMKKFFVYPQDYSVQQLITTEEDALWFNDLLKNDLFTLSTDAPCKRTLASYSLDSSKDISVCFIPNPYVVLASQKVTEVALNNNIVIYNIEPNENMPKATQNTTTNAASGFLYQNYISEIYPSVNINNNQQNFTNLYPISNAQPLSTACSYCDSCSSCAGCGACVATLFLYAIISIIAHGCASTVTGCAQ